MLDSSLLPLASGGTRLRRMADRDAAAYAIGTEDPAVRRFGHLPESEYTLKSVQAMIRDQVEPGLTSGTLAVLTLADSATDEFVGSLVLFDVTTEAAEVGFWIHPDSRGAGHARRGLELAARFAQGSGLRELTARTVTDNEGSQHCLIAAGFHENARHHGTTPAGYKEELIHYQRALFGGVEWPRHTERLRLRLHESDDAPWLHALYSRPETAR